MALQPTPGAIRTIYSGQSNQLPNYTPILQLLDVKKIAQAQGGSDRYRVLISDGTHFQQAMLATQWNDAVVSGKIAPRCLIRIGEHICNPVHNKKIVIIVDLEVVSGPVEKFGAPVNIDEGPVGAAPQQAAPQQQQQARGGYQQPPQQQRGGYQQQQQPQRGGYQQQQPQGGNNFRQNMMNNNQNRPPPGRDDFSQQIILPISKLNFHTSRWTIKARVTQKSAIREFNSPKLPSGKGKLISVDLVDAQGGEIRATMFSEAVDMFNPILEVGRVYYISRGQVKAAYKKTPSLKNDFELTLDRNSVVQLCEEDDNAIPSAMYNVTPIARIQDLMKDEIIDVVALVSSVSEAFPTNTKTGSTMKRSVVLFDASRASIELTLWGDRATNFDPEFNGVLGLKAVKVSDFNNRTLTSQFASQITYNPNVPEAQALLDWYAAESAANDGQIALTVLSTNERAAGGGGGAARAPREKKTFSQIKDEGLGRGQPFTFQAKGMVTSIRHGQDNTTWYNSCPDCKRKINFQGGVWVCDNCDGKTFTNCQRRYVLSLVAADHTGHHWLGAFDEAGAKLLGRDANEVGQLKEENPAEYDAVFQAVTYRSYQMVIRAKEESYQDEQRVKCTLLDLSPVDFVSEGRNLIHQIHALLAA